jgi:DNA mismatch repair protein MutS
LEDDWRFEEQVAEPALKQHFKVQSLDGFGLRGMHAGVSAAGALLTYIQDQLKIPVGHIRRLSTYTVGDYLVMDRVTQRNLELTESLQDGSRRNTLLEVLDATQTPMGGRLLRQWIQRPLTHVDAIRQRQDAVEQLFNQTATSAEISDLLAAVKDLERLMMRVSAGYAGPRDLLSLAQSLAPLPRLRSLVKQLPHPLCSVRLEHLRDLSFLSGQIAETLADEVPLRVSDGGFIRSGFNRELDEVRAIQTDAKAWLKRHQEKLRDELGIKTLKVGQNRVFGYFIEVSKGQADKMPETFIRRQTLVNSERFISPTLKDYEAKVLTAEERIAGLETALFQALRESVAASYTEVMDCAQAIAQLDCLNGFAAIARERHYERPLVEDSGRLEIREGRHPVIEAALAGESFVPNDTSMSQDTQQLLLITGPNMAGKSTYIRQVALITILAQVGAFVPAQEARIGVVDKVFARIGASDDLSRGQSTFMVEMTEAANILNPVTDQSLVILDEIGRGTSTYDGISIAWAMAEHLLKTPGQRAKTLFATHYCELVRLEEMLPGAVNYHVAVKDCDDSILFLRKIVRGGTDRSYGIHVGRLAGLPESMLQRAESILSHLEANAPAKDQFSRPEVRQVLGTPLGKNTEDVQFLLFQPDKAKGKTKKESQALKTLTDADPNALSPLQAHALLIRLRDMVTA